MAGAGKYRKENSGSSLPAHKIRRSMRNKDVIQKQYFENRERFASLQEDAYDFIMTVTNSKEMEQIKERQKNKEKGCDMCQAIREMIEDGREDGRREGRREGREEENRKMNRLTLLLLDENRIGDLRRAAEDGAYKERLLREYQIV